MRKMANILFYAIFGSILLAKVDAFWASNRAIWSVVVDKVCLDMEDASYAQMSQANGEDLSEETVTDWMGMETLYCKHGCCGDNRYPECCEPDDAVSQKKFETYKLIIIIASGVGGAVIIGLVSFACVRHHMKKKRLIRDIEAINKTNQSSDPTSTIKVKGNKASEKPKKEKKDKDTKKKEKKFFKSSKKAHLVEEPSTTTSPSASSYASLNVEEFLKSQPATAAVKIGDNVPVFLPITTGKAVSPNAPKSTNPSQDYQQPTAYAQNPLKPLKTSTALPPVTSTVNPKTTANLASLLTTPLADGPTVFSGPYDSPAKKTTAASSSSPKSSTPPSKKSSTGRNSSLALTSSSPLPDIPWDEDDLMMYFSDPKEKY